MFSGLNMEFGLLLVVEKLGNTAYVVERVVMPAGFLRKRYVYDACHL